MARRRKPRVFLGTLTLTVALVASLEGCYGGSGSDAGAARDGGADAGEPADALYRRLGGTTGIQAIVDGFAERIAADPKINGFFLNSSFDASRFTTCLTKQITALAGGPATYPDRGEAQDSDRCRNMRDAHRGLGVSTSDLADFTSHLVIELTTRGVEPNDVERILSALQPASEDTVENPRGDETIYLRAGGKAALIAVADDLYDAVTEDPKINGYFLNAAVDPHRYATCMVRLLCQATGGPCKYGEEIQAELFDGVPCRQLADAHRGLGVSAADFADFQAHLVDVLHARGMPEADVEAILRVLASSSAVVEDRTSSGTIYQRMGRKPAVVHVVRDLLARVAADPKINGYFLNDTVDRGRLEVCLVREVCQAAGGPCKYGDETGAELSGGRVCRNLTVAHRGLGVSAQDFNDFAADLVESLTSSSAISQTDVTALLGSFQPLTSQVVEDPTSNATVYQRVGRKVAIVAIVADFAARVRGDAALAGFFGATDAERFGTCFMRKLCELGRGPCKYGHEAGPELFGARPCRDVASAHQHVTNPAGGSGAAITHADFVALVNHLVDALVAAGNVSAADRAAIGTALQPLCAEVVPGGTGC